MHSPAVTLRLCLELAAGFFLVGVWLLWVVHVPARAPERLAHLSRTQRKRRIRAAGWLCMACGTGGLLGAILVYMGVP